MADFNSNNITLVYNNKYEILTPDGFKQFDGILKGNNKLLKITLINGLELKCTPLHKILTSENREYTNANKLTIGSMVLTNNGLIEIISIESLIGIHSVYEVLNVHDNHIYNINDIYCHQCLYLDEFAFIKPHLADEFIASVFPTISAGKTTQVIITSCVTKDTYIFTDKGINQISDFVDDSVEYGGYKVNDYKVMGMLPEFNSGYIMHNEGKVDTKIITTKYSSLECSLEHKLWACRNGNYSWYKSKELEIGDFISIKYGMNCWGNDKIDFIDTSKKYKKSNRVGNIETLTPEISYLLGLYISEGNASNKKGCSRVDITCGDDVSKTITNIGLRYYLKPDKLHYQISSGSLVALLLHLGFDIQRHAPRKIIPKRLMQLSKECTSAMLQGIFDGDGWTTKDRYRVGIKLSSKELIEQIRILLLNYGILATYNEGVIKPSKLVTATSYGYGIEITKYEHVKKYFNEIGFRFNRKQEVFESFVEPTRIGDKEDVIPFSHDLVKQIKKDRNFPYRDIKLPNAHKALNHYSRTHMLLLKNELSEKYDITNSVFDEVNENVIWVPIKSITDSSNYVYDVSLPEINDDKWCHSVIYNGIIAHNTPNGMNHFFRMWEDAIEETDIDNTDKVDSSNGYIKSEMPWNAVPGRDAIWARNEMKKISEIRFNQEYLCEFIGSVSTLIDHHFLKSMESTKPMKIANMPEYIRIYSLPLKKEKLETEEWEYVASLDSGYGVYQDSTVLQIFLVKSNITAHQVAVISSNKLEIEEFCKKCNIILRKYHNPSLIIEQNGPGIAASNYFNNALEYENLLHFDPSGHHMGLWASEKLKQNACILLKTYVQRKFLHLYDRETINELFSFGRVSQERWGALGGNHDDHITAMYWIPYYLQSPMFYGNIVEVNMKTMEEDEYILKTEEDIQEERNALEQTRKSKLEDMRNAATYLPKQISNPHRKDPDADDVQGSGLMFKR